MYDSKVRFRTANAPGLGRLGGRLFDPFRTTVAKDNKRIRGSMDGFET